MTIQPYFISVSALLCILSLTACALNIKPPSSSSAEARMARQATTLTAQGQFDHAARIWLTLARQNPVRSNHYRLLAAEDYRQETAWEHTAVIVPAIRHEGLQGNEPVRLDLLRADLALHQHKPDRVLQLTRQISTHLQPRLQRRVLSLRIEAMMANHDAWGAVRTRRQLDNLLHEPERTKNRQKALNLLKKMGVTELQKQAANMHADDPLMPWISLTLGQPDASPVQNQVKSEQVVGTRWTVGHSGLPQGYMASAKLALLIPENDRFMAISQAIREGFFTAYFETVRQHLPHPSVRVYDTTGTAEGAVKAYLQAVRDGARQVVGPLTHTAVHAVLEQSRLPVPVLALNSANGEVRLPTGSSDFALLPETEGSQAADYMVRRGFICVYMIISSDDFARRAARAFKNTLETHGGHVQAIARISDSRVDYHNAIISLDIPVPPDDDLKPATTATAGAYVSSLSQIDLSHTALFISMPPGPARLLLPQLRVLHIHLPVFATSHIYNGEDDPVNNNDLNGVTFCDAPWLFDTRTRQPDHKDIAARLPTSSHQGGRLFAFGIDAWRLVPYMDWLRRHPDSYLAGASGQLSIDASGHVHRVLIWAKFRHGLAHPTGHGMLTEKSLPAPTMYAPTPEAIPKGMDSTKTRRAVITHPLPDVSP